jgi:hypothetical protein
MTDYPAPETLSHQDLSQILDKLRLLLENLPNQLPSKPVSGPDASQYASLDRDVLVQEETVEIEDDDSDDEEPTYKEDSGQHQSHSDSTVGRDEAAARLKLAFAVDSQIDINSRALLDI